MGGKYLSDETLSSAPTFPLRFCVSYVVILDDMAFLAEARLILSKMVWKCSLEMAIPEIGIGSKSLSRFEPKAAMISLKKSNA